MKKPKLIYIYPSKSSFIRSDINFLSNEYEVLVQDLKWGNPKLLFLNWCKQFIFLIKHIKSSTAVVISFAGYFSLLPILLGRLFSVKTFLILNGTDCVSFPKYQYGSLRKPLLRFFIKHSQKKASRLLPVDASLIEQDHCFDDQVKFKRQGFLSFFPEIKTPISVIPNGFDLDFWRSNTTIERTKGFVSVVASHRKSTAIFKGVDLIIAIAKIHPKQSFTIIGMPTTLQKQFDFPSNVILYEFVDRIQLKHLYQQHSYYLQLSVNEGFGCALSEAMLCGCIPIVSNVGALPSVAGKKAFFVQKRTINELNAVLKKALSLSSSEKESLAVVYQEHIRSNFSIDNRERMLRDLL